MGLCLSQVLVILFYFLFLRGYSSVSFKVRNKCTYTVWPGSAGTPPLSITGFSLQPGESITIPVSHGWSGRLWGRTLCSYQFPGKFSCVTGDCASSTVECVGLDPAPPVTLVEFRMNGSSGEDFFEVSVAEGFNLPVMVESVGSGNCEWRGCLMNLNEACPAELKVTIGRDAVACKTPFQAFGNPQFNFTTPHTKPAPETCGNCSIYSDLFKNGCPRSRLHAHDPPSSTSCVSAHYTITFCPTLSSASEVKSKKGSTGMIQISKSIIAICSISGFITVSIKIHRSRRGFIISVEAEASPVVNL